MCCSTFLAAKFSGGSADPAKQGFQQRTEGAKRGKRQTKEGRNTLLIKGLLRPSIFLIALV